MPNKDLLLKSFNYPFPIWLTYFQQGDEFAGNHPDTNPHRHRYYELLFFKEADNVIHQVDFMPFNVVPQSLFFISPRQIHFLRSDNFGCKYKLYVITFSEDFLAHITAESEYRKLINDLFSIDTFLLLNNTNFSFENLWYQIQQEINAREPDHNKVVVNLFRSLLIYLKRQSGKANEVGNAKLAPSILFATFQKLIEEHSLQHWLVEQYAGALHITTRHLNRLCTTFKGCSAQILIHDQINMEAKRNLRHTQLQVKEVAFKLGFKDHAYFSRFFKRMNQESPESFRSRLV